MKKNNHYIVFPRETAIHILSWVLVFSCPLLFLNPNGEINWQKYLHGCMLPSMLCIVFYVNFLWLTPRFVCKGKMKQFIPTEVLTIVCGAIFMHASAKLMGFGPPPKELLEQKNLFIPSPTMFLLRDMILCFFSAALGIAIRLSMQWAKAEAARKEAELGRTEAELKNLRNQINPHFLLNTLNNIYALTAINTEKAQNAIQELSRLLRYILYHNQDTYGSIHKEVEFLRNYIELMRIRIPRNVDIQVSIDVPPESEVRIAPLIFISLIENAFKHGISPTQPSHIYITLCVTDENDIVCRIENSYFPKSPKDKSGSGIGLSQVQCRLDLLYKNQHEWQRGTNDEKNRYTSLLIIHSKQQL